MSQESIIDIASYLRAHATELGDRILDTFPPLQNTKDPVASRIATLLRKALPAQALAITGTAKYLRSAKAARIVAECGAGKTYMAQGAIGQNKAAVLINRINLLWGTRWRVESAHFGEQTLDRINDTSLDLLIGCVDTLVDADQIPANIVPKKLKDGDNDALTTPLSVTGTAVDLDAELSTTIVGFVGSHLQMKNTPEKAKTEIHAWIEKKWLQATTQLTGKRLTHIITPESFRALCAHHLHDLLEQKRIPNLALFEAFYNYCFVPKRTIGTQLLTVRRDKRERAAFAATQEGGEGEEEDDEGEEGFCVSLGENKGFREDADSYSE
jgi:PRTRC genetic system protein E